MGALDKLQGLSKTIKDLEKRAADARSERITEIGQMFAAADMLEVDDDVLRGVIQELKDVPASQSRYRELAAVGSLAAPKRPGPKKKPKRLEDPAPSSDFANRAGVDGV
jgi:hypothetical protein